MKDVKISPEIHRLAKSASKRERRRGVASFVELAIIERAEKFLPRSAIEWQKVNYPDNPPTCNQTKRGNNA